MYTNNNSIIHDVRDGGDDLYMDRNSFKMDATWKKKQTSGHLERNCRRNEAGWEDMG